MIWMGGELLNVHMGTFFSLHDLASSDIFNGR